MRFNNDGFNERTTYIRNSNDLNKLRKNGINHLDNSFAQMRTEERRNLVETTNQDQVIVTEEARGNKDNFLIRNNNMNKVNSKPNMDNPVSNVLNRNMFRR